MLWHSRLPRPKQWKQREKSWDGRMGRKERQDETREREAEREEESCHVVLCCAVLCWPAAKVFVWVNPFFDLWRGLSACSEPCPHKLTGPAANRGIQARAPSNTARAQVIVSPPGSSSAMTPPPGYANERMACSKQQAVTPGSVWASWNKS